MSKMKWLKARLEAQRVEAVPDEPPNPWTQFVKDCCEAWEAFKRPEWVSVEKLTTRDTKLLSEFASYYERDYPDAYFHFASGVKWAATKERWAENQALSLAELMAKDKLIGYAQKARQSGLKAERGPAEKELALKPWLRLKKDDLAVLVDTGEIFSVVGLANGQATVADGSETFTVYLDQLRPVER